jgi:proliferating cell nuclear antigen
MARLLPALTGADRIGEYEMKLMDIDSEQLGIPDTDYDATVSMPSAEFAKIMRDLKDLGESVKIEAQPDCVKFTAEGEIGTGSVMVKPAGSAKAAAAKKGAAGKAKVKKENKKTKREGSDDEDMDEDDEDVKPDVKDESGDEEENEDEDEDEDDEEDEEDEAPRNGKNKKSAAKGKKTAEKKGKKAKGGEGEEERSVVIQVASSVALNFSIKYLNNFAKSTPLATEVILSMSNDVPLLVSPGTSSFTPLV